MHAADLPIPEPCNADWSAMRAVGATSRHCDHCDKAVHDLSAMSDLDARALLANDRVCVRFHSDITGRVMHRPPVRYRYQGARRAGLPLPRLARRLGMALGLGSLAMPAAAGTAVDTSTVDPESGWALWAVERLDELLHGVFGPVEEVHQGQVAYPAPPVPVDTGVAPMMGEPPPPPRMGRVMPVRRAPMSVSVSVPTGVTQVELRCVDLRARGAVVDGEARLTLRAEPGDACVATLEGGVPMVATVALAEELSCELGEGGALVCE